MSVPYPFAEKRILLTGGSGFLGRHVLAELRHRGAERIFHPGSRVYDLTRPEQVRRLFEAVQPELVIHLAAVVGGIGANRRQPGRFFYENAIMGLEVMEQARLTGCERFVTVGTICSYPRLTPVPFREQDLWQGYPEETNAPYGLAKKMLLVQGQAYRKQYGFDAIHLLMVNLFGPHDNFDPESSHVIPAIIRKCLTARARGDREITLWGTGRATREFLFVEDAARAVVDATERYDSAEPVNIGSGVEISIRELAGKIAALCDFDGDILWDDSKPDGQPRRCLDVSRARDLFGFSAQTSLEEGLRRTIDWYRRENTA